MIAAVYKWPFITAMSPGMLIRDAKRMSRGQKSTGATSLLALIWFLNHRNHYLTNVTPGADLKVLPSFLSFDDKQR